MAYRIRRGELVDVHGVGALFNQYRMFYNQSPDLGGSTRYIKERIERNESVIWVAEATMEAIQEGKRDFTDCPTFKGLAGFVQLYPSFSSVSMAPIWVLNDLFVHAEYRQQGIARKLLQAAGRWASESGAVRITLSTAISNQEAQALYESEGYAKDTHFMYYELNV